MTALQLVLYYEKINMRIEQEPIRKPGEKVNFFHPDYPIQQVEERREVFDTKFQEIQAKIEALQDPQAQEILKDILGLFGALDTRIKPTENFVANESKQNIREIHKNTNQKLSELQKWQREAAKSNVRFG